SNHIIELTGVKPYQTRLEELNPEDFVQPEVLDEKAVLKDIFKYKKKTSDADVLLLGDTPGMPTTGLLYLASFLRRNGLKAYCRFYDSAMDSSSMKKEIEELLEHFQPKVVAISMKWFLYIARVIDICKIVKNYSQENSLHIKVVAGGNTASYYWEEMIKYDCIDYLVRGDGEEPLLKICQGEDESNIPNCVYKKNGKIIENHFTYVQDVTNSHQIYLSHLDEILLSNHASMLGTFFIYTHKGCIMNCLYCAGCNQAQQKTFNRKQVFQRRIEEVRKDIQETQKYTSTYQFEFDILDKTWWIIAKKSGKALIYPTYFVCFPL
ncbi:B12-binding domain-containing radical SAM protein, partial [Acidobacteriota bacterium]